MKTTPLSESEIKEVEKIMVRRSRFLYKNKTNLNYTVMMLNQIRGGNIDLDEKLPGGIMDYRNFLYELDILLFVT